MSYIGRNPNWNTSTHNPQSADPANPSEGTIFFSNGTSRSAGFWQYIGGQWQELGSGSAGINYIENSDAEGGTQDWRTYNDGSIRPIDGDGAGGALVLTASAVNPLRGTKSFQLAKDAASRQGQGTSVDFAIDAADQNSIVRIQLDYSVTANYEDGDLEVFIYDIDNAQIIDTTAAPISATSLNSKHITEFQTTSSTNYRLIFHIVSANFNAWDFKFDNVQVGPRSITRGPIVEDWKNFTPVINNGGTTSDIFGHYRRIGDAAEIRVFARYTGTGSGGTLAFNLNSSLGLSVDFSKITSTGTAGTNVGSAFWFDNSGGLGGFISPRVQTTDNIAFIKNNSNSLLGSDLNSSDVVSFTITLPIQGWSTNTVISEDFGNRRVYTQVSGSSNLATAGTPLIYSTVNKDLTTSYNSSTGEFTVPKSGLLLITGYFPSGTSATYRAAVNGSTVTSLGTTESTADGNVVGLIDVVANDIVTITASDTLNTQSSSYLTFTMLDNPQTLAGSEVIACRAVSSAGSSILNATTSVITYPTVEFDTHNSYDTLNGTYTVPQSGKYEFRAIINFVSLSASSTAFIFTLQKNSTTEVAGTRKDLTPGPSFSIEVSGTFDLIKGDTIRPRIFHDNGGTRSLSTTDYFNAFEVKKIG